MLSHNVRTHKSVTPSNSIKEQCLAQALSLLIAIICFLCLPRTAISAVECQFVLGFATLRDLIGHEIVGECLENERHGANGDALQQTTGGLLVWRKADNWTAFTDGYRTWINGPDGLVQRLNTERFEWEADYAPGDGIAAPTPTPTPTPIPTPTGSPASDRAALVAFYNATDGPNWDNSSNWLSNEPLSEWFGVSTDASGRVTALNLGSQWNDKRELLYRGNNLSGSIPPAIGNLSNLDQLILSDNNLSGSIPPEIGTLTNLNTLNLSGNALTGSIPPEIGNLSNLDWLSLADNNLSGSIPPVIGNLSNLDWLNLADNNLTGPIPPEIGNLSNLDWLHLSDNNLTGPIPPEIGKLTNLNGLFLRYNALTGSIPPEIGNLSNLDWLSLADNTLSGPIPPEIGNLSNLNWLTLDNGHCGPPKLRTWLRELRERRLDVLPCIDPRARLLPRALLREDSDGLSLALDADLHDPQEVSVSDSAVVAAEIQNGWLALSPRGRGEAEVTIVPLNGGPPATAKVVVRAAVGTFGIDIVIEQPASDLYADTLTAAADRWSAVLDGTEWEGRDARKNCERWARDVPVAGGGNELTVWALRETAPDSLSMTTGWAWSCRRNEGPETEPSRYYPIAGTVVVNEVYRNAPGNVRLMLHEIGHILGLAGAFPPATGLVTEDRRYFIGPQAVAAFRKGGGDPDLPGIPLASDRVHWGSGVRDELMASAGSSDGLSVAALADAGYTVDFSKVIPCDTSNNCLIK